MKKEIKDKWVNELRSGKRRQGKNALKSGDRFCCLGVLCDLYDNTLWEKQDETTSYFFLDDKAYLPKQVKDWAGIKNSYGYVGDQLSLVQLNDSGKSFKEIADVIEKEWENL